MYGAILAGKAVRENVVAGTGDCRQSHDVDSDFLTALKESTVTACEENRLPLSSIWLPVQTSVLTASLEIISSAVGIAPILSRYIFPLPVKTSLSPLNLVALFFSEYFFWISKSFFLRSRIYSG